MTRRSKAWKRRQKSLQTSRTSPSYNFVCYDGDPIRRFILHFVAEQDLSPTQMVKKTLLPSIIMIKQMVKEAMHNKMSIPQGIASPFEINLSSIKIDYCGQHLTVLELMLIFGKLSLLSLTTMHLAIGVSLEPLVSFLNNKEQLNRFCSSMSDESILMAQRYTNALSSCGSIYTSCVKQKNLKTCCTIAYCSKRCQKTHWKAHKSQHSSAPFETIFKPIFNLQNYDTDQQPQQALEQAHAHYVKSINSTMDHVQHFSIENTFDCETPLNNLVLVNVFSKDHDEFVPHPDFCCSADHDEVGNENRKAEIVVPTKYDVMSTTTLNSV